MTVISQLAMIRLPLSCVRTGGAVGLPNDGFASLVDLRAPQETGGEAGPADVPEDDDEDRDSEVVPVMAVASRVADVEPEGGGGPSLVKCTGFEGGMRATSRGLEGPADLGARAAIPPSGVVLPENAVSAELSAQVDGMTLAQDGRSGQADNKAPLGQNPSALTDNTGDTPPVGLERLAKTAGQNDLSRYTAGANPADGGAALARVDTAPVATSNTIPSQGLRGFDQSAFGGSAEGEGMLDPQAGVTAADTDGAGSSGFTAASAGVPSMLAGPAGSRAAGKAVRTGSPPSLRAQHPAPIPDIEMRGGAAHLMLDGDELGRIDIVVQRGDAGMTVVMRAERGESAELMRRNAEILHRELAEGGIGNARLDFSQGGSAGNGAHDPACLSEMKDGTPDPTAFVSGLPRAVRNVSDRVDVRL